MSSSKGILWSIVFFIAAAAYLAIPTYLIVVFWPWLNSINIGGQPIYTLSLFLLFLWIITLIISLIFVVAGIRAIVQRKNEDLGIPKPLWIFALISVIAVLVFMIIWGIIFGEIAFFTWSPF